MKKTYPKWLDDAVVYEIYPQTFFDSNGDGIGDLPGITAKLDYIKSLNANAIWLNPCFVSPFQDAGYDISDFYTIAPRYGTNDDFAELCRQAHAKGIKIILDLVAGHTSVQHPWFIDSCNNPDSPYRNYFVWTDGWGQNTGNYRFINGYARRDGFYMINFFYCQPALNYGFRPVEFPWQLPTDHPDCQSVWQEMKNIMKFWLDLGADGFRVDMASSLVKGSNAAEGITEIWNYYRTWLDKHYPEAVLVSEWSNPPAAIDAGFHVDFMVHFNQRGYTDLLRQETARIGNSPYHDDSKTSFFDRSGKGDASTFFADLVGNLEYLAGRGFVSVPTGNHDIGRVRTGRTFEELKVLYAMLFSLPGVPFLYYGDEIGMDAVPGLGNVEGSYNRSSARTPMQWDKGPKAGFSKADPAKFYLPLDPKPGRPTVAGQEKDPASLLNFTRNMTALRAAHPALGNTGSLDVLYVKPDTAPVVYRRTKGKQSCVCAFNPFGKEEVAVFGLEHAGKYRELLVSPGVKLEIVDGAVKLTMPPATFAIYQK